MMLGHVAEVLGNDSWKNLVTSRILEPLGMNSTWMLKNPSDVLKAHVARPYSFRDGEFRDGTMENFFVSYFKRLSSVYCFGSKTWPMKTKLVYLGDG